MTHPRFSIVIPAHDEAANLPALVEDLRALAEDFDAEVIVVNDGSDDNTPEVLRQLAEGWTRLRIVTHDTSRGQSAALRSGIRAARAEVIATLDGDGQNPPENLRGMFESFLASPPQVGMVQGERVSTSAPRSAASTAFNTTSRASSTQQSEYSKPRLYASLMAAPSGSRCRFRVRVAGSFFRPPR
jgi:glycosyltransferase involved in cell wall biosynthesis